MEYLMKKSLRILSFLMVMVMVLPMCVVASPTGTVENAEITMPMASPEIDGVIDDDGSWSEPSYLNETTAGYFWGTNPLTSSANMYFAYDENGLYFAADITDNSSPNGFIATTDYDDIDNSGTTRTYGWNGDVFTLMLDPLGLFEKSPKQNTAWYNVGIFEDGTVKVYRSRANEADITSEVRASGKITSMYSFPPIASIVYV